MPMRLSDHADGAARVRRFARRWYASLRYNLPFAWVYAVNVVLWVTLRRRPFETPEDFPGVAGLAAHDEAIRREFRRLRARTQTPTFGDLDPGQSRLATDRWRALLLWFWGRPAPLNLGDCPETAAALSQIVGLRTAFFSTLEPRTSLPWHMGPYAGVLRVHLGVEVPPGGACGIRVGRERRTWANGELLVFDDTYPHTAWNRSDQERVVLFLDIERPMPHRWQRRLNRRVLRHLEHTERIAAAARRGDELMGRQPGTPA
ncbi:MAG: aspartyl/asparaginyl beta-hydroxylase domain-containing protein [Microthrixaceae bacterium]